MTQSLLFRRTANGDLYPINLGAILNDGLRVWDPSYSLSQDPEVWEKAQQSLVISGSIERALLAVACQEWGLEPFSDAPEDVALAGIIEDLFRRIPRFSEGRRNLAEARFLGTAFAQITGDWKTLKIHDTADRTWWVPGKLIDIDRRRLRAIARREKYGQSFHFDWELYSPSRKRWEELGRDFPLISHVYTDNESRLGFGRGVMDSIYFGMFAHAVVEKDGLQGLRRWAQGLLKGTVGLEAAGDETGTNEQIRDDLRDKLLEMIGDNVLVLGEGEDVEVISGGGEGYQMVEAMLDRIERNLITRIEGTPLSTMDGDVGGSEALGREQGNREHAQRRYDRESLGEALGDLVRFTHQINIPTLRSVDDRLVSANCPIFAVHDVKNENPRDNAETLEIMGRAGMKVSLAEAFERTGWRQPEKDEEVLEAPQGAEGSPFGGLDFGSAMAAAAKAGAEAAIKAMGSGTATISAAFDESKVKRDAGKFATKEGAGAQDDPKANDGGAPVVESPSGRVSESVDDFTRDELRERYASMRAKPNSLDPFDYEPPPAGTLSVNADGELQRFEWVDPESLVLGESVGDVKNREDFLAYVEWAKDGKQPPPVDVFRSLDGEWKVMSRRRTAAAIEAGVGRMPAWVEVQDDNGFPIVVEG